MSTDINILRLCLTTPHSLSPVVVGPPGIGKSQRVKVLANSLGWPCEVLSPGERGEGAFGVVPVPNGDGYLHYPAPDWVKRFDEGKQGLLFIDEINTAPPALQPALLGLLLDGRIGGHQLPPGVRRVAAMNPVNQAAGGWDLPPALANRMQYLTWNAPTASEWSDWLLEEAAHQDGNGWTKARAMAAAFHRKHPGRLLEDSDKVLASRFPPAFATPRSWETAVRMLAACYDGGDITIYPLISEGILGKPVSLEWCTWLRQNDLPDPEVLLLDPSKWQPNERESDKVFATCFAVAEAGCADKNHQGVVMEKDVRVHRWHQAWRVLERALPLGKGMVAIGARRLGKNTDGIKIDPGVRRIIMQLREVLSEAGAL